MLHSAARPQQRGALAPPLPPALALNSRKSTVPSPFLSKLRKISIVCSYVTVMLSWNMPAPAAKHLVGFEPAMPLVRSLPRPGPVTCLLELPHHDYEGLVQLPDLKVPVSCGMQSAPSFKCARLNRQEPRKVALARTEPLTACIGAFELLLQVVHHLGPLKQAPDPPLPHIPL